MHTSEECRLFVVEHSAGNRQESTCCCKPPSADGWPGCLFGLVWLVWVALHPTQVCGPFTVLPARMRSNAWTTVEEFDFLTERIPQFICQQEVRSIAPWLAGVATNFFVKFPSRSAVFGRDQLTNVRFSFII